MRPRTYTGFSIAAWIALAVAACGGDAAIQPPDAGEDLDLPPFRAPVLTAVQPPTVLVGSAAFVLEAEGAFDSDAIVTLDGVALPTRVISATTLEADVAAGLLTTPRVRWVQVVHAGDGGGLSEARRFEVIDTVAAPVLDELIPDRLIAGTPAATIHVDGWNFRSSSVVMWGGSARPTTFVGSTRLSAAISAIDLATEGTVDVTVVTPDAPPVAAPLVFTIETPPASTIGVEALASVTTAGIAGGGLGGALSVDGRYVAFASLAPDLVAGDGNGFEDVFVRDTCRGASPCTPSTIRVSVDSTGGDANAASRTPAISGTGRYVAFLSSASDLVVGASVGIYVRDTCLGASSCTPATILASILPEDGVVAFYGSFRRLAISRDGRFVAFENYAQPLGEQVFLADTCLGVAAGCTPRAELVSRTVDGSMISAGAEWPALSATGRYVAFQGHGPALDGLPVTATRHHVYVLDTCLGAGTCTRSFTRATVALGGSEAEGYPIYVAISDDGRHVGFASYGSTWTAEANPSDRTQVFVRDTCIAAVGCTPATTNISAVAGAASNHEGHGPTFSADARFVAFASGASDLVVNDANGRFDVFVRDTCLGAVGCSPSVRRVSVSNGVEGNHHSGTDNSGLDQPMPSISGDGSITGFSSKATNLAATDSNAVFDVYVAGTGYTP